MERGVSLKPLAHLARHDTDEEEAFYAVIPFSPGGGNKHCVLLASSTALLLC